MSKSHYGAGNRVGLEYYLFHTSFTLFWKENWCWIGDALRLL